MTPSFTLPSLLALSLTMTLSGCNTCSFPDASTTAAPGWVCSGSADNIELSAVGFAEKSAAGASFSQQQAASSARAALAKKIYKDSTQHQILTSARVLETATSPTGRVYVLVGIVSE